MWGAMPNNRRTSQTSVDARFLAICRKGRIAGVRQDGCASEPRTQTQLNSLWNPVIRTVAVLLLLIVSVLLAFTSCGNGGGISAFGGPSGISIAYNQVPPSPLSTGAQAMVIASVANDSTDMGVDWNVSCSSAKCGSFGPVHTASGAPTTFTAPASLPPGNSVNITAASTADKTKTVTVTVTLAGPPVAITLAQPPPSSLQTGAATSLIATVTNDLSNLGVDWTVSCQSASCGSLSLTHTVSGTATIFTAPAAVPAGNAVTITATQNQDRHRGCTHHQHDGHSFRYPNATAAFFSANGCSGDD